MSNQVFGQTDTLFFKDNFDRANNRFGAQWYELANPIGKDSVIISRYAAQTDIIQYSYLTVKRIKNGLFLGFFENGMVKDSAWFTNGIYLWHYRFWENGQIRRKEIFEPDSQQLVVGECFDSNGVSIPYYSYEILPVFNGDLFKFIQMNIVYPPKARRRGIEGRVVTQFVINEDGSMDNIKIRNSPHPLLSESAIELLNKMPKWTPGLQEGQPVKVKFTLPIVFTLNNKK